MQSSLAAHLRGLAERVPTPTRVAPSERTVAKHCVSDLKSARNRRRGSLASREGLSFERTATGIARKQASALEGLLGGGAPRVSGQKVCSHVSVCEGWPQANMLRRAARANLFRRRPPRTENSRCNACRAQLGGQRGAAPLITQFMAQRTC